MRDPIPELQAVLEGRYRIERELGAGGMGTVYLASDLKHERSVALKVLRPEVSASVGSARFLSEIRTTAKLQHPHLVPLFDSGEAAGHLFYVMPFLAGESVRDRIAREGPLPVEDALRIASECADGLDYAHRQGILHRDIKPANILLSEGHAVIADFGIATAVSTSADRQSLTASGVSLGSVGYMSPEQMAGDAPVDARADVFAMGCVLHEMLSGERLFRGSTPQAVLARQLDGVEPVTKVRPSVPAWAEEVIRRSCAATPGDRFQSAAQLRAAIEAGGRSAPAPPRVASRTPVLAAGTVLAVVTVGGLVSWMTRVDDGVTLDPTFAGVSTDPVIAVLPLEDLAPTDEHAAFAAGIHQDLIAQLAKIGGLTVLPRQAVMLVDPGSPLSQLAGDLGADFVLTGSVQRAAARVRLSLDLQQPGQAGSLWSSQYDEELSVETIFDVQEDIARSAAREMAVTVTPTDDRRLAARTTTSLEAYDLFASGRSAYENRGSTRDSLDVAVDRYRRALEVDEDYALAYAGIGDAFAQGVCCYSFPLEWADSARLYATRAIELDGDLVLGYNALGKAYGGYEWRDSTIAAYLTALEIDPQDGQALNNVAFELRLRGDLDLAAQHAYRSRRVFPVHPHPAQNLANAYAQLGLDDQAGRWFEEARRKGLAAPAPEEHMWADPTRYLEASLAAFGASEGIDGASAEPAVRAYLAGAYPEATAELRRALRADPEGQLRRSSHHTLTALGLSLWLSGDRDEGGELLGRAEGRALGRISAGGEHWQYPFDLAAIHAVRGEVDEAFRRLDQAYDFGFRSRGLARSDPALEGLRSDPRFEAWFARIEADVQVMRERILEWERTAGIG